MTNTLFISHLATLSGAERSLLGLIENINRAHINPLVIVPHHPQSDGPLVDALRDTGIIAIKRNLVPWISYFSSDAGRPLTVLGKFIAGLRTRVWAISELIKNHRIDIVYTNTITTIEGALAAHLCGKPHIWHLREALVGNPSLTPFLPNWLCAQIVAKLSTRILAPCKTLLETAYPYKSISAKSTVIYNGVDTELFSPNATARTRLREEFALSSDTKLVGIIGSLTPVKSHQDFLHAVALSRSKDLDTKFFIVGDGPAPIKNELVALTRNLDINDKVIFTGQRSDVFSILPSLDLLMLTSRSEAFPRTIIEAMSCGVPVVSTNCGGTRESVIDGKTGILVPVGSRAEIAAAMDRILLTDGLGKKMGAYARSMALERFSIERYAEGISRSIIEARNDHFRNATR